MKTHGIRRGQKRGKKSKVLFGEERGLKEKLGWQFGGKNCRGSWRGGTFLGSHAWVTGQVQVWDLRNPNSEDFPELDAGVLRLKTGMNEGGQGFGGVSFPGGQCCEDQGKAQRWGWGLTRLRSILSRLWVNCKTQEKVGEIWLAPLPPSSLGMAHPSPTFIVGCNHSASPWFPAFRCYKSRKNRWAKQPPTCLGGQEPLPLPHFPLGTLAFLFLSRLLA